MTEVSGEVTQVDLYEWDADGSGPTGSAEFYFYSMGGGVDLIETIYFHLD